MQGNCKAKPRLDVPYLLKNELQFEELKPSGDETQYVNYSSKHPNSLATVQPAIGGYSGLCLSFLCTNE